MRLAVDINVLARGERGAGFADHLISGLSRAADAETTNPFDKAAARHADFTLLSAGSAGAIS